MQGDGQKQWQLNQRFTSASEGAAPAVWDWDVSAQKLTASPKVFAIYGLPDDDSHALDTLLNATIAEDRGWFQQAQASRGGAYQFRIERRCDQVMRWIDAAITVALDPNTGAAFAYTAVIEDITERFQSAHALLESEERFRLAIEAGKMAVWEVDLLSGTATVSPALNLLFGFPADANPSFADYRSRYAPGEVERLARESATLEAVRDRFTRGELKPRDVDGLARDADRTQVQAELTIILPDGTKKHLMYRAQYIFSFDARPKITGLLVDITDRKATEDRLQIVARELQHRVKNSLALVQAIAHQSARSEPNPSLAMENFLSRLRALSVGTDLWDPLESTCRHASLSIL